jgi:iduronate 2-sulfatase
MRFWENRRRVAVAASLVASGGSIVAPLLLPRPAASQEEAKAPAKRLNVLFIAVDDLRPSFGVYGGPIKTPNIDRLAGRGTTFIRAYCQQAVCSPSRTSLLTGQRPDTTQVYDLVTHFRKNIPDTVTLPQYFKQNGYVSQGMGKIFHDGLNDAPSWSVPHWRLGRQIWGPEGTAIQRRNTAAAKAGETGNENAGRRGPAWESADMPDEHFVDGATANHAIETLREVKEKPFFLAVGFVRPHLPFVAPKKYWDLYKESDIKLPENYQKPPKDVVPMAMHNWGELRTYDAIPKQGPVTDEQAKKLIQGYYAATSYMDAQVGKVLDELERLGLRENTVVVFWGDHGWSLGEHGLWCKHTNFEDSAHAPLILAVPGQKRPGAKVENLAEFVDVYPTLCAAAGLPVPPGLAGQSLLPSTDNPDAPTKSLAFSQYPRGGNGNRQVMGYSLRDDRYRYTEWGTIGAELYDHQTDPHEDVNIANRPESKGIIARLSRQLHEAYPGAKKQAEEAEKK